MLLSKVTIQATVDQGERRSATTFISMKTTIAQENSQGAMLHLCVWITFM